MAEADLTTLEALNIAMGHNLSEDNPQRDKKYSFAITAASRAIRKFTDRSFGLPVTSGTRIYEYDSSGIVDIDDAAKVDKVEMLFGGFKTPLLENYYRAEPQEGPPYEYLMIPKWQGIYSPEMGFTKNLDVISKDRGFPGFIPRVEVTGEWGWPTIPIDVEQACIWTAAKFQEKPDQLVSESIANYAYTSQLRGGGGFGGPESAIPSDAQDLLASYTRFLV